jgi:uncharacterized protein YndB with AHSA1/START domain
MSPSLEKNGKEHEKPNIKMMSKHEPIVIERIFNAPVEKVWKAITDKDQMKQWYFDIPEFKPEVGFEFRFEGGKEDRSYVHLCKITEVVAGRKLKYSWRYDGYGGNSFVTFELFAEGSSTRLRLTHEGLETFPSDNPDFAKENFVEGWTHIIGSSLKDFVETGFIQKSIKVQASVATVWDVLLNPAYTRQWGNAFGEGVYVETDWTKGSEVLWKDKEGEVGAKGVVAVNEPHSLLKVSFYDEVDSTPPAPTGEYAESYALTEKDGISMLSVEAGPLAVKHIKIHSPLWEQALEKIKALAEK